MAKIFVTGIGIVSPLGIGVEENLRGIKNAVNGISYPSFIDTVHKNNFYVGELKYSNSKIKEILGLSGNYSRTTLLAELAFKEAVANSKLDLEKLLGVNVFMGTTVGGMDRTELEYHNDDNSYWDSHQCGFTAEYLREKYLKNGQSATINTACSSSANSIMYGARMIKHSKANVVIAGGADALSLFTINGFASLKILDTKKCEPFSSKRNGLNLGEAAAFLVLESEESVKKNNSNVLCEITGWANTNDAYHPTALSPEGEGPYNAMKEALETANLNASDISYINTHGTATLNNDESEANAIKRIFDIVPPFSSTKSTTGHCLGAAGAIEAVFSIFSIQEQKLWPHCAEFTMDEKIGISPQMKLQKAEISNVLSNSFGFGGCDSALIFSKYPKNN